MPNHKIAAPEGACTVPGRLQEGGIKSSQALGEDLVVAMTWIGC